MASNTIHFTPAPEDEALNQAAGLAPSKSSISRGDAAGASRGVWRTTVPSFRLVFPFGTLPLSPAAV